MVSLESSESLGEFFSPMYLLSAADSRSYSCQQDKNATTGSMSLSWDQPPVSSPPRLGEGKQRSGCAIVMSEDDYIDNSVNFISIISDII